ncbi:MAG TPA: PAS domain-containing protein, partial [Azonexus sp.]
MTPNWMQPLAALLTGAALTLAGVRLRAWRRARPADDGRADRAAAELADARFRHVLETSPSGQLISGDDGRIVFANATAAGYFGLAPTELPGHAIDTLLPGHRRVASTIGAASAVAACDVTGQRRDGSEIPLQMSLT